MRRSCGTPDLSHCYTNIVTFITRTLFFSLQTNVLLDLHYSRSMLSDFNADRLRFFVSSHRFWAYMDRSCASRNKSWGLTLVKWHRHVIYLPVSRIRYEPHQFRGPNTEIGCHKYINNIFMCCRLI